MGVALLVNLFAIVRPVCVPLVVPILERVVLLLVLPLHPIVKLVVVVLVVSMIPYAAHWTDLRLDLLLVSPSVIVLLIFASIIALPMTNVTILASLIVP